MFTLHRHTMMQRDGVGMMSMCHRFNKTLRMHFRADDDGLWVEVPPERMDEIVNASSFEEAMTIIRRKDG